MLTDELVLKYVKDSLGHPFTEIELLDKEILFRCKEYVLKRYFSQYVPVYKFQCLDIKDENVITENTNRFKIIDPDNAGIMSVIDVIRDFPGWSYLGITNYIGTLSYSQLPEWYKNMMESRTAYLSSPYYITWEFIHPNYIEIRPFQVAPSQRHLIVYEAQQQEFNQVPAYRDTMLLQLCESYIKKNIAEIREKYQELRTVFGTINLNYESIKTTGENLWDRTIERLEKIPPHDILFVG